MYKPRTEDELREALSRMCHAVWGSPKPGARSVFTIPVDREHDADCILADAIDELVVCRADIAWLYRLLQALYDDWNGPLIESVERARDALGRGPLARPGADGEGVR